MDIRFTMYLLWFSTVPLVGSGARMLAGQRLNSLDDISCSFQLARSSRS
jgi:hypothetical protein